MSQEKENPFAFLGQAKPGSLFRMLDALPRRDQAMVLANLPPWLTVQVMAYFPDAEQGVLMASIREARRAPPGAADATLGKLRGLVAAAREAAPAKPAPEKRGTGETGTPPRASVPDPGRTIASAYGKAAPRNDGKPQPWKPRATDETPINAPKANRPPPVKGDPAQSPLKASLLGLLGLSGGGAKNAPPPGAAAPRPRAANGKGGPGEGLIRTPKLRVSNTPRMLGAGRHPAPAPAAESRRKSPPAPGGRKVDGMAILAAILRNSSVEVRHNVAEDSPALFRALKERMFVFDDLLASENGVLAQVFTAAPLGDSALALRFGPPALRERVLRAVSPRRAEMLRDAAAAGPGSGLDAIEEAQNRVLGVALRLQEAGRIVIDPDDPDLVL